ncbi:Chlorophyllase enzyme [Chryseobacterium soldanellicola]|uniref:Chlorophyllase enzyme n=1 Tax=Chryseobacterium soldanellicola TaxID=311333 RepID=A0A1H1FCI7_9FLAO|nr:hypothetical protein [Chryseobacterium soldanellicola]SDQ98783.1 Chlorophyllase enzyme [Chryseobacterium soldanellicola]
MNIITKILLIATVLTQLLIVNSWAGPSVSVGDQNKIETRAQIERKYTAFGPDQVRFSYYPVNKAKYTNIKVWYPQDLQDGNKSYPVVIFANGTDVINSSYEEVFKHLASWGFIVIGNDDKSSWSGESSAESLDLILSENSNKNSIFYQKVNAKQIGISGHSQGGVAAINAVTNQKNGQYYSSIFAASTPKHALAVGLKWSYDIDKINIPYFAVAGTGGFDAGKEKDANSGIAPLWSMRENFYHLRSSAVAVIARRKDVDHGDMLFKADGYMTAWFLYTLLGDQTAAKVFTGINPEITNNDLWQDVNIKNLR